MFMRMIPAAHSRRVVVVWESFLTRPGFKSGAVRRALCSSTTSDNGDINNDDETSPKQLVTWGTKPVPDRPDRSIGFLTLNSPSTYNALTVEMGKEFSALCHELTEKITFDQDVAAIVLRGGGDKAFSAGGNLEWLHSLRSKSVHANADQMVRFYKSFLSIRDIPVPIIASLQGPAVGAGAGLALACDLRTAVKGHRIILGLNFTRLGIHAGMGSAHWLMRALGGSQGTLNELLLTGRMLSGEECLELGLVNRLSEDSNECAWNLAVEIARRHPVAVRTMIQTLRARQDEGLEGALQREAYAQAVCYAREDWGRGLESVVKKQEPIFDPYHSL